MGIRSSRDAANDPGRIGAELETRIKRATAEYDAAIKTARKSLAAANRSLEESQGGPTFQEKAMVVLKGAIAPPWGYQAANEAQGRGRRTGA